MRIVRVRDKYSVVSGEVETYDVLPVQTYLAMFNQKEGFSLVAHPNIDVNEKIYGIHEEKAQKVLGTFRAFERSLGIILSGDKGIGKSVFAKMICQKGVQKGYPVIIVDEAYPGIARFVEQIEQECIVLFDEFDKTFRSDWDHDEQAKLLSLFDGTAGGKKLYIVTCNELRRLNDYIVNRPGRFHYHFRFEYPKTNEIREYLEDKLEKQFYTEIDKVISFANRINLNYDCLRAIAFELNQGIGFADAITELNILNISSESYDVFLYYESGEVLHHYQYRTNLYETDSYCNWITLYDERGRETAEVKFEKQSVRYDIGQNLLVIPGDMLQLDYEDGDEDATSRVKKLVPSYMAFVKCEQKKLHYAV